MRRTFPAGTILWVKDVPDENNANHKDRRVALVQDLSFDDAEEGHEEGLFLCVGITTKFGRPIHPNSIELNHQAEGRCHTSLTEPSVAKCEWRLALPIGSIIGRAGFAGSEKTAEIVRCIKRIISERK